MESDISSVSSGPMINDPAFQAFILVYWGIFLFFSILQYIAWWKIFKKAGRPGWKAIIPIYNTYVMLQIINKSAWWLILFMIPLVNIIFIFLFALGIARVFNKGVGFALGSFFFNPIFHLILAFDKSQYIGLGVPLAATMPMSPAVNAPINPMVMPTINPTVMPSANVPANPPATPPTAPLGQ